MSVDYSGMPSSPRDSYKKPVQRREIPTDSWANFDVFHSRVQRDDLVKKDKLDNSKPSYSSVESSMR